jgi:CBS domain containing-hemolysin-like protein
MFVLFFVLLSFFCVTCEKALHSLSKKKLSKMNSEEVSSENNSSVVLVNKVLEEPSDVFNTLFFVNLASCIVAVSLGTVTAIKHWGEGWGFFGALTVFIFVFMLIGKIIPEVLGKKYAREISCLFIKIIVLFKYLFYLLTKPFDLIKQLLNRIVGIPKDEAENEFTEEAKEIISMVTSGLAATGENEEIINQVEKTMLHGVIEFADMVVNDVMTPRPDIIAVAHNTSYEDLITIIKEEQFSRIPVYEKTVDNIFGVVHIKDLILLLPEQRENFCLEKHVRQTIYVPETKKISELFMVMKKEKIHMAIVLDEYGSTAGIVTLEDLIEEIMGDIQDEHDREEPLLRHIDEDIVEINASMRIEELNEDLDLNLSCEEADTVGGLVFATLDRIPVEGDKIELENLELSVLEMEGHRIEKVRLNKLSNIKAIEA